MVFPPLFWLKVAKALTDEASERIQKAYDRTPLLDTKIADIREMLERAQEYFDIVLKLCDKLDTIQKDLELEDGTTTNILRAEVFLKRGFIAYSQRNFAEAKEHYERALTYHQSQAIYFALGTCLLEMRGLFRDRTEEAVAALEKCIAFDPQSSLAIEAGKKLARLGRF